MRLQAQARKSVDPVTPLETGIPKSAARCVRSSKGPWKRSRPAFSDAGEMLRALNDVVFRESSSSRAFVIQRRFVAAALAAA